MRFRKSFVCSLIVGSFIVSSCTTETIEIPNEEHYTREFIKQFGVADPDHDWNNATQGSVTVITSTPTNVQVLADIRGDRYIFADYRGVNGSETINFTIPKGVSDIIVTLNGRQVKSTLGATIDTRSRNSRAIWENNDNTLVDITRQPKLEISDKAILSFGQYLPEEVDNRGKVTQNFSYLANGPFIVYPVYWNTNNTNTLSIYYIQDEGSDNEKMVIVPFYTIKTNDKTTYKPNLEYLPGKYRTDGLDPFWADPKGNQKLEITDSYNALTLQAADWNDRGKHSFADFDEEDYACFKQKFIDKFKYNYYKWDYEHGLNNYFNFDSVNELLESQNYSMPESVKEDLVLDDIKYEIVDDSSYGSNGKKVVVTQVHIAGCDDIFNDAESNWVSANTGECSHPKYEEYKKLYYNENGSVNSYDDVSSQFTGDNALPALWRSEGIHIDVAEGTHFGMCLLEGGETAWRGDPKTIELDMKYDDKAGYKVPDLSIFGDNYMFFSQSKYNTDKMHDIDDPTKLVPSVHAATYNYPAPNGITYQVLAFEDWYDLNSTISYDLNDVMFFISSNEPTRIPSVKDEDKPDPVIKKYDFIIAAEDLGGTCDWDFNDMVVGVNVLSTNYIAANSDTEDAGTASKPYKEVTVTPLASGGTLPIYLMYRGKVSTSADDYESSILGDYLIGREFHSWLSGGASSSLTPLNVGATASMKGEPITFHVPDSEYTLSMHSKYSATDNSNNMGGFWVLVINHNDNPFTPTIIDGNGLNIQTDIPDGKGITKIEAPDENKNIGNIAPQMICIGHEWLWPREGKMIHNAYPTTRGIGFEGWVKDSQGAANGSWYGSGKYDESLVTTRNM